jgi:hypothetical protein
MTFRGIFKVKNLNAGDEVKVGTSHNNLSAPPSQPSGPAQYLVVDNVEYLLTKAGSKHKFFGEPSWNGFNNKTVDVEGVFVGQIIVVSSITKVD